MAKQMSGHKPGGGSASRVVTEKPQRLGTPARGMHPGGVSQLGEAVGNKITEKRGSSNYRGDPWTDGKKPISTPLGNTVSAATTCGPGGSREVMRSGTQGQHGSANPGQPTPGANKPIFPGFK